MARPIATEIHDRLTFAGFKSRAVQWGVIRMQSVATADAVIGLAKGLPEPIIYAILRDRRHSSDAAIIAAFRDAQELKKLCAMPQMRVLPESVRNMDVFFERGPGPNGEPNLMSLSEARKKLMDELAKMDVHIDTARRVPSARIEAAANGNTDAVSAGVYASRKTRFEARAARAAK
jgi:hypothetical protein